MNYKKYLLKKLLYDFSTEKVPKCCDKPITNGGSKPQ